MAAKPPEKSNTLQATSSPPSEYVVAALEEALKNARLLRVSSSLFLKEAKELLDSGKASVLLWADDCMKDAKEAEKEGLEAVRESSTTSGVPLVTVESKKQLGEWVGLGKIGRLRRAATCLLAVVLDPEDTDEAPSLAKLLKQVPHAPKPKRKLKPVAVQPMSPRGSKGVSPGSAKARPRSMYAPDNEKFRAALASKDTLPVLKRTGSSASSRRDSADGAKSEPVWIGARQQLSATSQAAPEPSKAAANDEDKGPKSGQVPGKENRKLAEKPQPVMGEAEADSKAASSTDAAVKSALEPENEEARVAAEGKPIASTAERATGCDEKTTKSEGKAQAAMRVKEASGTAPDSAPKAKAAKQPQASAAMANEKEELRANGTADTAASPTPVKDNAAANGKVHDQDGAANNSAAGAKAESGAKASTEAEKSEALTPASKEAASSDPFIPGAGLPGTVSTPVESTPETASAAARSSSVARPDEVSAFRMSRRKRTSSAAASKAADAMPPSVTTSETKAVAGTDENGSSEKGLDAKDEATNAK